MILQLNALAHSSGISFDSIEPGTRRRRTARHPTRRHPFAAEPIQVQFTGSFYNLVTFLQRVRNLVRVQNGKLFTAGRLFDVSDVSVRGRREGVAADPGDAHPQRVRAPDAGDDDPDRPRLTDTTSTTTTGTTTTTSNPTSAAPSTSGGS